MSGEDGFLSRWSKRKKAVAEAEADERQDVAAAAPEEETSTGAESDEALTDDEILEKYGLKDPDEMREGDDFSGFMRAAVPDHLRRRALRRLWVSNPVLANLDGLNDYDGDFTGGSVPLGTLKTAYKVGSGFLQTLADGEAGGEAEAARDAAAEAAESAEPQELAALQSVPGPENVSEDVNRTAGDGEPAEMQEESTARPRRRMAFRVPTQ